MKFIDVTAKNQENVQAMINTGIPYKLIKIYECNHTRVVYTIVDDEVHVSMSNKLLKITISDMDKVTRQFLGLGIEDVSTYMSERGIIHFRANNEMQSILN